MTRDIYAPLKLNQTNRYPGYQFHARVRIDGMTDRDGETVCEAQSEHVFLNREGHFVRMKREMPEFCAAAEKVMRGQD